MPAGAEAYDSSGNLIFSVTDRLTRWLGVIFIGVGESGSVTNDGFLTGSPWYQVQVYSSTYVIGFNPSVSFSGNQMFFANSSSPTGAPFRIAYGVY
jgi:hypothetical protein